MSFQALMDELGLMAKAQNDGADGGDGKIDAAAAAGGDADAGVAGGDADAGVDGGAADAGAPAGAGGADAGTGDGDGDGDGDDDTMGKSFSFKLEDGTEVEAVDGTALVKALMERQERSEADVTKAFGMAVSLIKSQGEMLKSLQDQVGKLSASGRGRKAVLSVSERPTVMRKSENDEPGITPAEFLAKCLTAQATGKITASDVSRAESYLNRGLQVPPEIVARVAAQ